MFQNLKKIGLALTLAMVVAPLAHAQATNTTGNRKPYRNQAYYMGGEIGYSANTYVLIGFRFITSFRLGSAGRAYFDVLPTAGLSTGWTQWLRAEGGGTFTVGTSMSGVYFTFAMIGTHFHLSLNSGTFSIGPSFVLPGSVNIFWKNLYFGVTWGIDAYFHVGGAARAGYEYPFFFRFTVAYKFK